MLIVENRFRSLKTLFVTLLVLLGNSSVAFPQTSIGSDSIFRQTFEKLQQSLHDIRNEFILIDFNEKSKKAAFRFSDDIVLALPCPAISVNWENQTVQNVHSNILGMHCHRSAGLQISIIGNNQELQNWGLKDWLEFDYSNWSNGKSFQMKVNWQIFEFAHEKKQGLTKISVSSMNHRLLDQSDRPFLFQMNFHETQTQRVYLYTDRGPKIVELQVVKANDRWVYLKNGIEIDISVFSKELQILKDQLANLLPGVPFYESGALEEFFDLFEGFLQPVGPGVPRDLPF